MSKEPENFAKHFELSRNIQFWVFVLSLCFSYAYSFPKISLNEEFSLFSWTHKDTSSYNYGYNLTAIVKSQQQINNKLVVGATVQVPGLPDWLTANDSLEFTFINSSPANIVNSSPAFKTSVWLQKIRLSKSYRGIDSLHFTFPVPDQISPYRKYDYFTIAVNDSIHLQYQGVEDTIFMGSFLNYKKRNEPDKWLVGKGAIMVRVSNNAPFKIQSIQMDSLYKDLIAQYLGCDLYSILATKCDYFGIDFTGKTKVIRISNVKINADTLIADSNYTLTWTTEGNELVESCVIFASFDGDTTKWWLQPMINAGPIKENEVYSWTVPGHIKACKFKVVASGNGQIVSGTSALYPVKKRSEPKLDDSEVVNNFILSSLIKSDSVYLNWKDSTSTFLAGDSVGILKCSYQFIDRNDQGVELIRMFPVTTSSFVLPNPDGLCYLGLLVRNSKGKWSKSTPKSIVSVGKIVFDTVTITASDTHNLFNNSLRVWNTSNTTFTDTMEQWNGSLNGFIPVSSGYAFKNGEEISQPLWFEVPYLKSLNPFNIRLYSFDINKGGWIVGRDTVIVDTAKSLVRARNSSPGLPFMFLIDTLEPVISFLDSSNIPVKSGQRLHYNISITDNVKNCIWKFMAGAGDEQTLDLSFYVDTVSKKQSLGVTVPQVIVNGCTGFRSLFIVSDMVHEKAADLGRPVIRDGWNCDNIATDTMQWTPVMVSATPDSSDIRALMNFHYQTSDWKYNTKEMRIIKWIPGHPKAFDGGWVEYNETESGLFKIIPGQLFWIKTKGRINLDFGRAVVSKLNAVDTINLPPNQWTDFSNPFPFDIYLGDIFEATSNPQIDSSIRIYSWDKDSLSKSHSTSLLYFNGLSGHNEPNKSIKGWKPYTVLNNANVPVSILIPAISTGASTFKDTQRFLAKKENNSQWSLGIKSWGSDNINLATVYLGETSGLSKELTGPLSPSFSFQSISIYDKSRKNKCGVVVSPMGGEPGNYFELLFENNASNAATVNAVIGEMSGIEQSNSIRWYDSEKDLWIDAQDTMKVSLKPKQRLVKIIAIGNEQYFRDLGSIVRRNILALRAVYPNPFAHSFSIQYSLPYETRKVTFLLYDLLGKVVWQRDILNIHPGPSLIKVDKMMATGLYVLQMKVLLEDTGSPKVLNRRVMCVR